MSFFWSGVFAKRCDHLGRAERRSYDLFFEVAFVLNASEGARCCLALLVLMGMYSSWVFCKETGSGRGLKTAPLLK
jgi:hypothetical protein